MDHMFLKDRLCGPVVSLWFPCGFPVVSMWFPFGFLVVSLCVPCGFPLVSLWFLLSLSKPFTRSHSLSQPLKASHSLSQPPSRRERARRSSESLLAGRSFR